MNVQLTAPRGAGTGKLKAFPGYPRMDSFLTMDAVKDYFDRDKLVCLLCGREFVKLGSHVPQAHAITADDYKIRFGIPMKYGLGGKSFRAAARRKSRHLRKIGVIPAPSSEAIKRMLRARWKRRPFSRATREQLRERMARTHGRNAPWQRGDYEEFLRRVRSGRTARQVGQDRDMPSKAMFLWYLRRTPDLKREYDELWEDAPFADQVRANKTGERYCRTLVQLRLGGKTWPQVASLMKLRESTVRNMWHKLKRGGRLQEYR